MKQEKRGIYHPWFPLVHQYIFTRNDSWLNSFWIMLWGLFVLTLSTIWGFFITKPIGAIFAALASMVTGLFLYFRLSFKFILYGFTGFLNSRDITMAELIGSTLESIRNAAIKAAMEKQKQAEQQAEQ